MYLIRWTKDGQIAPEHADGVYSVPEWKLVIEKYGLGYFKAVSFYTDYESPYRMREEGPDRELQIAKAFFGEKKIPKWGTMAMKDAKIAYEFLQRDPIREHLKNLEKQLSSIDTFLEKAPTSVKEIKEGLDARTKLGVIRKEMREVRAEIADSIKEIQLKGGKVQSWLEQREFQKKQVQKLEKD